MLKRFPRLLSSLGVLLLSCAALCVGAMAINPVMPLWEHVPDGEPHIFGDRLYLYGSHESLAEWDVGPDYVLWSCPVDDLTDWTYHGVIFDAEEGGEPGSGYLTAPDVCQGPDGKYYMYTMGRAAQAGNTADETMRQNMHGLVMRADTPEGPFEYIGDLMKDGQPFRLFDPTLMVEKDEDGKDHVYIIGGSAELYELDPTDMRTIIDGPCTYKGVLIDIGGDVLGTTSCGQMQRSNYNGNTHGSLFEIDGQWYITYHRQTSDNQCRRQACIEPIDMTISADGDVNFTKAEVTSSGVERDGLDAEKKYSAAYACYLTNEAYIDCEDTTDYNENACITDVTNSVVVGVRYLNFDKGEYDLALDVKPLGVAGTITVELDDPASTPIAQFDLPTSGNGQEVVTLKESVGSIEGRHAVYFNFYAVSEADICEFNAFEFSKSTGGSTGGGSTSTGSSTSARYTITVNQAQGGTISPATVAVNRGSNKTFTITPKAGYVIDDVLVDGKSVGAVGTYKFENVTAAHTITAAFKAVDASAKTFSDVDSVSPYALDAMKWAAAQGIVTGRTGNKIAPQAGATRAETAAMLMRFCEAVV